MNNRLIVIFSCVFSALWSIHAVPALKFPCNMVVSVPVADLLHDFKKPNVVIKYPLFSKNALHKTQLLLGERLVAVEQRGQWLHVQALEQEGFRSEKNTWTPYDGWIKKEQAEVVQTFPTTNVVVKKTWAPLFKPAKKLSDVYFSVSFGTTFKAEQSRTHQNCLAVHLPNGKTGLIRKRDVYAFAQRQEKRSDSQETLRKHLVERAKLFLDSPYCSHGRSAYNKNARRQFTSLDCSGLTNLLYRSIGIHIPSTVHDQYRKSSHLASGSAVQPGDLIFFAPKDNPERLTHVMMYIGDGKLLEATGNPPRKTRIIDVKEKIGKSLEHIKNGETVGKNVYYFGSFLEQESPIPSIVTLSEAPVVNEIPEEHAQVETPPVDKKQKTVRHKIIASAKKFIRDPYRKPHEHNAGTKRNRKKVDCSELIQKSFRANNIAIPRNSHAQFTKCKKIKHDIAKNLKPGDLIFAAAAKKPKLINHVMLYIGDDHLLESTGENGKVRTISLQRRIGMPLRSFKYGRRNRKSVYYAGTLLA